MRHGHVTFKLPNGQTLETDLTGPTIWCLPEGFMLRLAETMTPHISAWQRPDVYGVCHNFGCHETTQPEPNLFKTTGVAEVGRGHKKSQDRISYRDAGYVKVPYEIIHDYR